MGKRYNFRDIEAKWQKRWLEGNLFEPKQDAPGRKMYVLDMFPYPSGDGLHVGHVKTYTASDVVSRYLRMKGFKVLHPTGWDAFGLPTENTAIKKKVQPAALTQKNIERFRAQMQTVGFSYDWSREINTTDPEYFKWTQWIFIKLFNMGLAYEDTVPINWCPSCKTGLANEEVVDGKCERCGELVVQKPLRQWLLRITKYADRLLAGLDGLEWPQFILDMQKNWIGKSEGAEVDFVCEELGQKIPVFTTRLDTLYGATFLVLSPEHPLIKSLISDSQFPNVSEVKKYVQEASNKSEMERKSDSRPKTGIFSGLHAVSPVSGIRVPIWIADYVLVNYGTGAIMAVPAHDERDYAFAKEYNLPITQVVLPGLSSGEVELPYIDDGVLINSGNHSGHKSDAAREEILEVLQIKGVARRKTSYSLRDWVFSRQRYWGEPIPIIHCEDCGPVPVPEDQLPVELPAVKNYEPTGTGESPLADVDEWVNVKCPMCAKTGRRETNTMPQWAGSSWYWLRYTDPHNKDALASSEALEGWLPVDLYVGGAEHAVLHLLYARFWNMALYDQGVVPSREPFKRFKSVGLLLGEDGQKMSKSRGNVVNPDDVVSKVGADALRVYMMFMGPFDGAMPWSEAGLQGASRFLRRIWKVVDKLVSEEERITINDPEELVLLMHKTLRRVAEGTEQFRFNVAIAAMMEFLNELEKQERVSAGILEKLVLMLAPYAPHLAEELWELMGHSESLMCERWPDYDAEVLKRAATNLPVQVNGKVRGEIEVMPGLAREKIEELAREVANVGKYLSGKEVTQIIYIEGRMINFVTKD